MNSVRRNASLLHLAANGQEHLRAGKPLRAVIRRMAEEAQAQHALQQLAVVGRVQDCLLALVGSLASHIWSGELQGLFEVGRCAVAVRPKSDLFFCRHGQSYFLLYLLALVAYPIYALFGPESTAGYRSESPGIVQVID